MARDFDSGDIGYGAVGAALGGGVGWLLGRLIHGKNSSKLTSLLYTLAGATAGGAGGYFGGKPLVDYLTAEPKTSIRISGGRATAVGASMTAGGIAGWKNSDRIINRGIETAKGLPGVSNLTEKKLNRITTAISLSETDKLLNELTSKQRVQLGNLYTKVNPGKPVPRTAQDWFDLDLAIKEKMRRQYINDRMTVGSSPIPISRLNTLPGIKNSPRLQKFINFIDGLNLTGRKIGKGVSSGAAAVAAGLAVNAVVGSPLRRDI